ncbi:MAG: hypothetical protein FWC29_01035 [Methanomassiliicoccaceae archaeon]|nr:hypothetical protein [Methanomassiliicoccaceae archaeon]
MNSKILIAIIAAAVVITASAAILIISSEDSKDGTVTAKSGYDAVVWLDDGNNETGYSGTGDNVRKIIENALSGHTIVFSSNGNIASIDGVANTNDKVWTIFKWASPGGWAVFSDKTANYTDRMTVSVRYADKTTNDKGNATYSAPNIEVEYKVYYFIQFKEQYNSTEWMRSIGLSDSQKREGIWIEGTGKNNNEALADAVLRYLFPNSTYSSAAADGQVTYTVDGKTGLFTYGERIDMYGWFLSFFGWSDTKQSSEGGEYGTWTYWSQYCYHPDAKSLDDPKQWNYDQFSFGMYDITKYRYFGLVLQTTAAEDDVDASIPAPSGIPKGL